MKRGKVTVLEPRNACGCEAWPFCEHAPNASPAPVVPIDRVDVEVQPTPEGYVFVPLTTKGLETLLYTSVQDHDVNRRAGWLGASGVMDAPRAQELQGRLELIGCTVVRVDVGRA